MVLIMNYHWDETKNEHLKQQRDVCFEDVLLAISEGRLLDILPHLNQIQYPHQNIFIVTIRQYVYYVPYVEEDNKIFLKTIIPSRKYQKQYNAGA
jgi:uncharacterized DUF497 family protein